MKFLVECQPKTGLAVFVGVVGVFRGWPEGSSLRES